MDRKGNTYKRAYCLILLGKYLFSVLITFSAFAVIRDKTYLVVSLLEFCAILTVSYIVLSFNELAGHVVHFLLLLIYNVQTLVMRFGGSFATLIMLTNLSMFKDLKGKFDAYLLMAIPLVICSMIPAKRCRMKRDQIIIGFIAVMLIGVVSGGVYSGKYSPTYNLWSLLSDYKDYRNTAAQIGELSSNGIKFFHSGINDNINKPDELPRDPNIILIFTEGLSRNIITDDRDIMPNVRTLESESLHFVNYYNHSFATFRGLIGQLYSGYQFEDFDANNLISLQDIFKKNGYQTAFINTEPSNKKFSDYLASFEFDELITDTKLSEDSKSKDIYTHDSDAYDLLYNTILTQHEKGIPFFTAIYTFGTHVSLNSPDEVYGDGSNAMLNKFYNADAQFGKFFERFKNSPLFENTILVFTTDHATYEDDDFLNTFAGYSRESSVADQIPLCIYYKGIAADAVDANGRNSLDLAPTLLDYLDISGPNYFLGNSLFAPENQLDQEYDTVFYYPSLTLSTAGAIIDKLGEEQYALFLKDLKTYFSTIGSDIAEQISEDYVSTELTDDCAALNIVLKTQNNYESVWMPTWSQEKGQDDLIWHQAAQTSDGEWTCSVNLTQHGSKGTYLIHIYAGKSIPEKQVAATSAYVSDFPPYHLESQVLSDSGAIAFSLSNADDYDEILFPVWSETDDQDDLVWYHPQKNNEGIWYAEVKVSDHCKTLPDKLIIHIYGKIKGNETPVFLTSSYVDLCKQ